MQGRTISAENSTIMIKHGTLNLTSEGTVKENSPYYSPLIIKSISNNDGIVAVKDSTVIASKYAEDNCVNVAIDAAIWGGYKGADVAITNSIVLGSLEIAKYEYDSLKTEWIKKEDVAKKPGGRPCIKVESGEFTDIVNAVAAATDLAKLTVEKDVTIEAPGTYGVTVFGEGSEEAVCYRRLQSSKRLRRQVPSPYQEKIIKNRQSAIQTIIKNTPNQNSGNRTHTYRLPDSSYPAQNLQKNTKIHRKILIFLSEIL